jgi:Spx/MgsR family transcriptional regulator
MAKAPRKSSTRAAARKTATKTSPARKTAPKKKIGKTLLFLHKPSCVTCRKAANSLESRGYHLNYRDIIEHPLTTSEVEKLIGKHDHEEFLRPRSETYRKKNMKENPPSRREAVGMMAMDPELIRRPIVVAGGRVAIGYDENGMIRF